MIHVLLTHPFLKTSTSLTPTSSFPLATAHDQEYLFYSTNYANNPMKLVSISPWSNFSPPLAQLLFGILNPNPSHRFTAHEICHSEWFCTANSFLSPDGKCSNPVLVAELIMKNLGGGSQAVAHGSSQDDDEV